jgi:hypothetical protein
LAIAYGRCSKVSRERKGPVELAIAKPNSGWRFLKKALLGDLGVFGGE